MYDTALKDLLSSPEAHVLVVFGDQDDFTSISKYERWTKELQTLTGTDAQRLEIVRVDGASHFWRGRDERVLTAAVGAMVAGATVINTVSLSMLGSYQWLLTRNTPAYDSYISDRLKKGFSCFVTRVVCEPRLQRLQYSINGNEPESDFDCLYTNDQC